MLVYMRDSYLLYADTFAYFTLAGSAEIFFKTYYHYWSDLKEKSFIVVIVNMSVICFFYFQLYF